MVKSMTGYGRSLQLLNGRDITVEIKSVNHRYFEFSAKVPRVYGFLEEKLKSHLQNYISRGKLDVYVSIMTVQGMATDVAINHELAMSYINALREFGTENQIRDDISLSTVMRLSDVFAVRKILEDDDVIWNDVKIVLEDAIKKFVSMRELEGERMKDDVLSRLSNIENMLITVEERSPQTVEEYRNRLYTKMKEVLIDTKLEDQRILTEAAIFSEKVAVAEETVRLQSHIFQFREILSIEEAVGRKLDFLTQEINREANTIGSKAQDVAIARIIVEIKSEIEKIREQIQNIE